MISDYQEAVARWWKRQFFTDRSRNQAICAEARFDKSSTA